MVEPILPAGAPPRDRRPFLGYGMVLLAATLFAVNGTVSKVILDAGLPSSRLAEIRSTGALVGLGLVLALTSPARAGALEDAGSRSSPGSASRPRAARGTGGGVRSRSRAGGSR